MQCSLISCICIWLPLVLKPSNISRVWIDFWDNELRGGGCKRCNRIYPPSLHYPLTYNHHFQEQCSYMESELILHGTAQTLKMNDFLQLFFYWQYVFWPKNPPLRWSWKYGLCTATFKRTLELFWLHHPLSTILPVGMLPPKSQVPQRKNTSSWFPDQSCAWCFGQALVRLAGNALMDFNAYDTDRSENPPLTAITPWSLSDGGYSYLLHLVLQPI